MRHLVIIGFMGSGKSTLSSRLSCSFGLPIYSTDEMITQHMQMPIAEIFKIFGEDVFRTQETEIFKRILQIDHPHIIDCGGGFGAYQKVEELGRVIFLDLEFDEILERMSEQERKKRPLFASLSKARELFIQRRAIYLKKAQLILNPLEENAFLKIQKEIEEML